MTDSPHLDPVTLDELRLGEGSAADRAHLEACDVCQDELAALDALAAELEASFAPPIDVPRDRDDAILAMASEAAGRVRGQKVVRPSRWQRLTDHVPSALVASVMVGLIGTFAWREVDRRGEAPAPVAESSVASKAADSQAVASKAADSKTAASKEGATNPVPLGDADDEAAVAIDQTFDALADHDLAAPDRSNRPAMARESAAAPAALAAPAAPDARAARSSGVGAGEGASYDEADRFEVAERKALEERVAKWEPAAQLTERRKRDVAPLPAPELDREDAPAFADEAGAAAVGSARSESVAVEEAAAAPAGRMQLERVDVALRIDDRQRVRVTQRFRSAGPEGAESSYRMKVAADAEVSDPKVQVGERQVPVDLDGSVTEREGEAIVPRWSFEAGAKDEPVEVETALSRPVAADQRVFEILIPLGADRQIRRNAAATAVATGKVVGAGAWTLVVDVSAAFPIASVTSETHAIEPRRLADDRFEVTFTGGPGDDHGDLVLRIERAP